MPTPSSTMLRRLRSLPPLFFIGLFPVVCILWLWAQSTQEELCWRYCPPEARGMWIRSIRAVDSALRFSSTSFVPSKVPNEGGPLIDEPHWDETKAWGSFDREKLSAPARMKIFPSFVRSSSWQPIGREWDAVGQSVLLPFWMILLGWLPVWLLPAWWQGRRRRTKMAAAI